MDRVLSEKEQRLIQTLTEQVKAYSSTVGFDAEEPDPAISVDPETGEVVEPLA